jgi:hypothetical protein
MFRQTTTSILFALGIVAACAGRETEPRLMPAAGEDRLYAIANARCSYEMRCNNIGTDRSYTSYEECMREQRTEAYNALGAQCSAGIMQSELQQCLSNIQAQGCGASVVNLEFIPACNSDSLCRKATTEQHGPGYHPWRKSGSTNR